MIKKSFFDIIRKSNKGVFYEDCTCWLWKDGTYD